MIMTHHKIKNKSINWKVALSLCLSLYLQAMCYEFLILIWWERREKNIFMIIFPLEQLIKCFLSSRLLWLSMWCVSARICVNRFSIDNLICSFSLSLSLSPSLSLFLLMNIASLRRQRENGSFSHWLDVPRIPIRSKSLPSREEKERANALSVFLGDHYSNYANEDNGIFSNGNHYLSIIFETCCFHQIDAKDFCAKLDMSSLSPHGECLIDDDRSICLPTINISRDVWLYPNILVSLSVPFLSA